MLQDKNFLIAKLKRHFSKKQNDTKYLQEYAFFLGDQFNIPLSKFFDIAQDKDPLDEQSAQMLFWLAYGYDHLRKESLVKEFFSESEIEHGLSTKMQRSIIQLPFTLKMISVDYDSFIGSVSTSFLVGLQENGFISYNNSTQRLMNMVFEGKNKELYRLRINPSSVKSIKNALHEHTFIPNTITLNIPPGKGTWEYNPTKCELTITQLEQFDIIDGYHRLRAIMHETNEYPDFDYPMELRIVSFDTTKARQFIYQEDQKNPMKKAVSETFNVVSPENKIIRKVASDPTCVFMGRIGMEKDKPIHDNELLPIITHLWFKKATILDKNQYWLDVAREIVDSFNAFCNVNQDYLNKPYISYRELCAILYVRYLMNHEGVKIKHPENVTREVITKIVLMDNAYFALKGEKAKTISFTTIRSIVEELIRYE